MKENLERTIITLSKGSFEDLKLQEMFLRLGKIYFNEKFEEFLKRGYETMNSEDYALVDTIRYLIRVRNYYPNINKKTIFINNYLIDCN